MPKSTARTAVLVVAALIVSPAGSSSAPAEDSVPAHIEQAVQDLISRDQERVDESLRRLAEQDLVRADVTVCIDHAAARLSGRSRLWIESPLDHVRLMLNKNLEVLSVRDGRGDSLPHSRTGEALVVRAREGTGGFPLEISVVYEGAIVEGADAWVTPEAVALGPAFRWYPSPEWRDPARLRIEVRYPRGYSSVASGALAGMATSLAGDDVCAEGDVWDVPTPVPSAALVVGSFESSLTVVGDVFFGHHVPFDESADWRPSPSTVPKEFVDLLHFLEACNGPYPYEWLNIVRLPGEPGGGTGVIMAPGMVIVRAPEGASAASDVTLGRIVSGLARSWWGFWTDPGPALADGLARAAEEGWRDATGDADGALRLRGLARSRLMRALGEAGRGISLGECMGVNPVTDGRICGGKSAAVLEMLQTVIGGGAYCSAIRAVAEQHGGDTVGFGTFAHAFESAAGSDLDWFFYEWMTRGDLPSYSLDYESEPNSDGTFTVRGTIHQEGEPFRTPLPLTVDLGGWAYDEIIRIGSAHHSFQIRTDAEPMRLVIDERGLIPKVNRAELARSRFEAGTDAAEAGEWDSAVDELGAAAALERDNAEYALAYARALVHHGLFVEGLTAFDRAVELDPWNAELLLEASELHLRSGGRSEALDLLNSYVEARPTDPIGFARRARALVELGVVDRAESDLARARELSSGAEDADIEEIILLAEGRLHEVRGDAAAAARSYEAALAVNPVSDEARRLLRALESSPQK